MRFNKNIEFDSTLSALIAQQTSNPSIEDDLITFRMKQTQKQTSMRSLYTSFRLTLIKVTNLQIHYNYGFTYQKPTVAVNTDKKSKKCGDSSFLTAEDSFEQQKTFNFNKDNRNSKSGNVQLGISKLINGSILLSPRPLIKTQKSGKRIEKGLLGLIGVFNRVEKKTLAFRFTHMKIYSQIKALETKEIKPVTKKLDLRRLPANRDQFYRQWFKLSKNINSLKNAKISADDTMMCT